MTEFLVEPAQLHILISIFILIYFDYILFTKNNSNHTPPPTTTNTTTTTTYRYYHLLFSTHCLLRSVRNDHHSEPSMLPLSERFRIFTRLSSTSTPFKQPKELNSRKSLNFKNVSNLLSVFQEKTQSTLKSPKPVDVDSLLDKSLKRIDRIKPTYEKESSFELELNYDSGKENYDSTIEDSQWTNPTISFNYSDSTANRSSMFLLNQSKNIAFMDSTISDKSSDSLRRYQARSKSFVCNNNSSGSEVSLLNASKTAAKTAKNGIRQQLWRSFSANDTSQDDGNVKNRLSVAIDTTNHNSRVIGSLKSAQFSTSWHRFFGQQQEDDGGNENIALTTPLNGNRQQRISDSSESSTSSSLCSTSSGTNRQCKLEYVRYFGVLPTSKTSDTGKSKHVGAASIVEGLYSKLNIFEGQQSVSTTVLSAQLVRRTPTGIKSVEGNFSRNPDGQSAATRQPVRDFDSLCADLTDDDLRNADNFELTDDDLGNADADFEKLFLAVKHDFFS